MNTSTPSPDEILADAEAVLAGNGIGGVRAYLNSKERMEIRRLRVFLRDLDTENATLRERCRALERLDEIECGKQKRIPARKGKPRKSVVLCLSDTHTTEIVTREQTEGRNEHNEEIGRERLRSVVLQAIDETKREARKSDIHRATIWLGGDFMVNADLHYKFERNTPYEPLIEMEKCYEMLREEMKILTDRLPVEEISVVGSVSNHDRDTEKMQLGLAADRSYDTAMYCRLRQDYPQLDWEIARTYWTTHTVEGYSILFHHGHALSLKRNNAGAMVPQWVKVMNRQKIEPFDACVQGHYHSAGALLSGHYAHIANGSTVAENGYATDSGFPPEPPSQQLAFVNHDRSQMDRVVTLYA